MTGAPAEEEYRAKEPRGRAFLQAADYHPSPETPTESSRSADDGPDGLPLPHAHQDRPRAGAAGRRAGRWVELSREDAARLGVADGDRAPRRPRRAARSKRRRGSRASGRASSSSRSTTATGTPPRRATSARNELTITSWDPVSKQPMFKLAAVAVERAG